jgi:hypothetical protein
MRASSLLGRRSTGLSPAQALRLEDHLTGCARCSAEAAWLDGLRGLARSAPAALRPAVREQVIRRALSQAAAGSAPGERPMRWHPAAALAAAALVAAGAFALVLQQGMSPGEPERGATASVPVRTPETSPTARVLSGAVEMDGRLHASGTALGTSEALRTAQGATIALAHATIELRAGTALRWNAATRELRLDQGSLVADVDPRAARPFTVITQQFSVHVLGTRFEVSLDAVRVERGRVRVVAAGAVVAESLGPGERWSAPVAVVLDAPAAPEPDRDAPRRRERPASASRPLADPGALLNEARAHLSARRVAEARRAVDAALALGGRPSRLRAEAMSLRAECALVEGDLGAAIEAYLRVARAFGGDAAGQNALFAAARLEAERGRSAAAAALLERYLARYPKGRFVEEARARLRELGAVLDRAP